MPLKAYRSDLIKGAMAAQEVTREKLAEKTKLSPDTLSRIRNGEVHITLIHLMTVADALGLSMKDLFEPKPEAEPIAA